MWRYKGSSWLCTQVNEGGLGDLGGGLGDLGGLGGLGDLGGPKYRNTVSEKKSSFQVYIVSV